MYFISFNIYQEKVQHLIHSLISYKPSKNNIMVKRRNKKRNKLWFILLYVLLYDFEVDECNFFLNEILNIKRETNYFIKHCTFL